MMSHARRIFRLAIIAVALIFCLASAQAAEQAAPKAAKAGAVKGGKKGGKKAGKRAGKKAEDKEPFKLTNPNVVQRQETYKKVGDTTLKIDIFEPKQKEAGKKYPAIVFFFGGGWSNGLPSQFYRQSEYLASRGMIALSADYRVKSRQPSTTPVECVKDAKSAIRWVRANAVRLGIDPTRIAAGGGSAGGHIAAAAATSPGVEEAGEDASVSSMPNALVLFNPFIGGPKLDDDPRGGQFPRSILPIAHIQAGIPPAIILFGSNDSVIPVPTAKEFQSKMKAVGSRCELAIFEGQTHGFFNYGRTENNLYFYKTLAEADKFLASLGWIDGPPTLALK